MITIHKYSIVPDRENNTATIELPKEAKILSVDFLLQFNIESLCLWALVDTSKPKESKVFHIVGTGWDCSSVAHLTHIGTTQSHGFVWHIFT